jgi:hypothetical protein
LGRFQPEWTAGFAQIEAICRRLGELVNSTRCGHPAGLIRDSMKTKRLILSDAEAVARVHRATFDHRLPWLAGHHTPNEDRAYFENVVFDECEVWVSFDGDELIGFIAFRESWIDQLYVLPAASGARRLK